jgi:hypothetical protein
VRVTAPNGGDVLTSGQRVAVQWETHETVRPVCSVQLFYSLDGGLNWKRMTGSPVRGNPGSFNWRPRALKQKDDCKVKVVLKDSSARVLGTDTSDAPFKIEP